MAEFCEFAYALDVSGAPGAVGFSWCEAYHVACLVDSLDAAVDPAVAEGFVECFEICCARFA